VVGSIERFVLVVSFNCGLGFLNEVGCVTIGRFKALGGFVYCFS